MKRKISLVFLVFFITLFTAACTNNDKYNGYKEIYSVDSRYYFYVQPQYAESVSNLGYSNTVIVRYTTDAYALVSTNDYFDSLSAEQIGGYSRENFSMGDPAMDATFNNRAYIQKYFETYLGSSHSTTDVAQIKKITVNGHDFWLCHCYYYDADFDMSSQDPKEALSGEAYIYYTIYDGITYFINVTSVDMYLSGVKDAGDFINNFYIGTRMQNGIKFVWTALAVLVLIDIIFVMSAFFKIKIEPAVIIERIVTHLRDMFEKGRHYSPDEINERLYELELDSILGRVEIEKDSEDFLFVQNTRILAYLDEILGRTVKEISCGKSFFDVEPSTQLDYILGRKERPKLFKAPILPEAPIIYAVNAIHCGAYNEREDSQVLDDILGRTGTETMQGIISRPDDFEFKVDVFLSSLAEKNSKRRTEKALLRSEKLRSKELRSSQRLLKKKEYSEKLALARFERKVGALNAAYDVAAIKTYVPGLVLENITVADAAFNLDTILGRTLLSKLDIVLDRTVWSAPPVYCGTYAEELTQREAAVKNAALYKQGILDEQKRRTAVLPETQRVFYEPSLAKGLRNSCSANALNAIKKGSIKHNYDDADTEKVCLADTLDIILGRKADSLNSMYSEAICGPQNYEAYLKAEKHLQTFSSAVVKYVCKTANMIKVASVKTTKAIADKASEIAAKAAEKRAADKSAGEESISENREGEGTSSEKDHDEIKSV